MNLANEELDGLLRQWPAPARDDAAWEGLAETIVGAATAAKNTDETADFLSDPLPREEGEPDGVAEQAKRPQLSLVQGPQVQAQMESDSKGASKMADEQSGNGSEGSAVETPKPVASVRPRPSLRAIAERASQAGLSKAPSSEAVVVPSTSTPLPGIKSLRPTEASADDSGIVDLKTIHASVTAQQKAAAEKAKPASKGLYDDEEDDKGLAAAAPAAAAEKADTAKVIPISAAPAVTAAPAEKKGSGGAIAGVVIAFVGIAAAAAIFLRGNDSAPVATAPEAAKPAAVAQVEPTADPAKDKAPAEAASAATEEPAPAASADSASAALAQNTGAGAAPPTGAPGDVKPAAGPSDAPKATGGAKPAAGGDAKPGDLASAMAQAAGAEKTATTDTSAAQPAAGGAKGGSTPEQPSQGSVQAAVGSVMGGAKACVAGADDVSRANITFSSSGAVSSVSVTGWAAAHGKTGCVKSALSGAKVGAFSKPSFTVGVTIRP